MSTKRAVRVKLARLNTLLKYDPRTGLFIWLVQRCSHAGKIAPGVVAGTRCADESGGCRINIGVDRRIYGAHVLAWFITTGRWPRRRIDHKDGDGTNNKWKNLRQATNQQNIWNTHKVQARSKSGKTGVSWSARSGGQWRACIVVNGRQIPLGIFPPTN